MAMYVIKCIQRYSKGCGGCNHDLKVTMIISCKVQNDMHAPAALKKL